MLAIVLASCDGADQIFAQCSPLPVPGQYAELGDLRDVVLARYDRDPGGGLRVYWCEDKVPDYETAGLYLGCGELYATSLRAARHEGAHCYHDRLFGEPDAFHADWKFWEVVN